MTDVKTAWPMMEKRCERFQTFEGIRLGSVLSPMLLTIVMDEIIRKVTEGQKWIARNYGICR
jgi:hypothetical protein